MILIMSDVHGNLEALEAVLEDSQKAWQSNAGKYDKVIFLGDSVGYGPNPAEVLRKIRVISDVVLIGNHDIAVHDTVLELEKPNPDLDSVVSTKGFNPDAKNAVKISAELIRATQEKKHLAKIVHSDKYTHEEDGLIFAHSQPFKPREMNNYVTTHENAMALYFDNPGSSGKTCFVGHTHFPQYYLDKPFDFEYRDSVNRYSFSDNIGLRECYRALIVLPSVGQPRGGDPRAGYCIYDEKEKHLSFRRVEYDVTEVQRKMQKCGFPENLWYRLSHGR